MTNSPHGIFTAIVTPMTADDAFDEATFRRLVDFQIHAGIAGLLVIGARRPRRRPGLLNDLSDHAIA